MEYSAERSRPSRDARRGFRSASGHTRDRNGACYAFPSGGGNCMKRITTFILALGCASLVAPQAHAQSNETKTKTKTEHASTVNYTGCVQTGGQTRTYVLDHVAPIRKTTEFNADGSTTTSTTYALVSDGSVQLEPQIGHKVEIQGVLI